MVPRLVRGTQNKIRVWLDLVNESQVVESLGGIHLTVSISLHVLI